LVVKRYVTLFSEGVDKAFWKYFDSPKVPRGILDAGLRPRPAYRAYRVMTGKIGGFSGIESLSQGDVRIFKFKFKHPAKEVLVLWSNRPQTADLGTDTMKVTDLYGQVEVFSRPFSVGPSPIYAERII
jgi:hypothetical protein